MRRLLPALLVALAPAAAAQEVVVTGEITGADHQHYEPVPFDMPKGVERVTVTLAYDKSNRTVVDMGVWDPERFRGWSGGTRDRFTIAPSDATPGYLAGTLPAGRWRVMLGVPNARAGSRSAYKVMIAFDRPGKRNASAAIADAPINPAPGWYRGDLHMHDAHSDGSCASQAGRRVPCPLFRTIEKAAAAGLDFVAVTDHNTVAHFTGLRVLQPWFDRTLLIPRIEITTFAGHANIFGPRGFVDFRVGSTAVPDINALQRGVAAAGAILSINHPALPSGEACMGCGWVWPNTDWSRVAAIEAVNGNIAEGPLAGIGFWYARLNEGHRLTGMPAATITIPTRQTARHGSDGRPRSSMPRSCRRPRSSRESRPATSLSTLPARAAGCSKSRPKRTDAARQWAARSRRPAGRLFRSTPWGWLALGPSSSSTASSRSGAASTGPMRGSCLVSTLPAAAGPQ